MRKLELDPYQELANVIIIQAAKDWRAAVQKLKRYPNYAPAKRERDDCERFFRSEWCSELTEADGTYILRRLKKEEKVYDE